jgi:hypothetical protein
MDRLELSVGSEVLGFRMAPPLGETMKGEGYKIQRFFYLLACVFHCVLFLVFLFCICFAPCVIFRLALLLLTWFVALRYFYLLWSIPLCCSYLLWFVVCIALTSCGP